MAYNQEYPGVDVQMYNADWLLAEMHEFKAEWSTVKEEWKKFQTDLTQAWEEYKNSQEQSWEEFKDRVNTIMANFQIAIRHEWQAYKTELTHDWELFQQTIHTTNSEFQQYVNQQLSQYEINYKADMNNFNQAWQAYQTNINNIVNSVKDLPDDWETYKQQVDKEIADQNTYINNYFKNLDITANLEVALQNKIDDGSLTPILGEAFTEALNRRQNIVVAIVGDSPNIQDGSSPLLAPYLKSYVQNIYPNASFYEQTSNFYDGNESWGDLKDLKTKVTNDGKVITHVIVLVNDRPASYTSSNLLSLFSALQLVELNAKIICIATKLHTQQSVRVMFNLFWRACITNGKTASFFDMRPWINIPSIYLPTNGFGIEWATQAKHFITQSIFGVPGYITDRQSSVRVKCLLDGGLSDAGSLGIAQTENGVYYSGVLYSSFNMTNLSPGTIVFQSTVAQVVCAVEDTSLCILEIGRQAGGSYTQAAIMHITPIIEETAGFTIKVEGFYATLGEIVSLRLYVSNFSPYNK